MEKGQDLLEAVVLEEIGEDALPIVKAMRGRKNFSEFKLADSVNRDVNATRNVLYKLYSLNLAAFIRKKDKKKGWYIYYWTLLPENASHLSSMLRAQKQDNILERLKREKSGSHFVCVSKCIRLDFEKAYEFGFMCPECGTILSEEDNTEKIKQLEKELEKIKEKA
jgi:transcription initiation factor TFIIE subunit alpha